MKFNDAMFLEEWEEGEYHDLQIDLKGQAGVEIFHWNICTI
jgi:hypothetical protein